MATIGTLFAKAQRAQRQSDVIVDDQQILHRDLLLLQPVLHRLAAQVHVGRGFDDKQGLALVFHLRCLGKAICSEGTLKVFRQAVGNLEANIMTGVVVFGTYVSQTGYQVFHLIGLVLFFFTKKACKDTTNY